MNVRILEIMANKFRDFMVEDYGNYHGRLFLPQRKKKHRCIRNGTIENVFDQASYQNGDNISGLLTVLVPADVNAILAENGLGVDRIFDGFLDTPEGALLLQEAQATVAEAELVDELIRLELELEAEVRRDEVKRAAEEMRERMKRATVIGIHVITTVIGIQLILSNSFRNRWVSFGLFGAHCLYATKASMR